MRFEALNTVSLHEALDTTHLVWAATPTTLTVSGRLLDRGTWYNVGDEWEWPRVVGEDTCRWFVMWRIDHTLGLVTRDARNAADYPYPPLHECALAHGWIYGDQSTEPWERVAFVIRCRAVPTLADLQITHHLTNHHGHHWTYTEADGQVLVRAGQPRPGGGEGPASARFPALTGL